MNSLRLLNYIYIHLINSVPTTNKTETASILLNNYQILLREYVVTVLRSVQKYLSDPKIVLSETDLLMLTLVSDLCLQHTKFMVDMLKQLVTIFLLVKQRNSEEHILSICDEYLLKTKAVLTGSAAVVGESKEHCLACSGAIVFQSPWKAVCANGHPWDRCAVSLLTAATPKTRSCLGCNRKTISPEILGEDADESMDGKDQVESVIMKTLLTHITLCVYCGNRLKM
ncbi:putative zinc-finger of transcription factor IIIC complex-domain-containing protein [Obelidium mucronatum]|nr:putative zinc-finger of transcription factor IIIC complex-domain-containing protein [Obelidium mucronatum]